MGHCKIHLFSRYMVQGLSPMAHYIALIHKQSDSGYGVSFPHVPGITVVADSLDEAIHEGGVALGFAFEDWQGGPQCRAVWMRCIQTRSILTLQPMRLWLRLLHRIADAA